MEKEREKNLKELFKGSEDTFIVATKNGVGIVGRSIDILTLFTLLIDEIRNCEGIEEEHIQKAVEYSKLDNHDKLSKISDALEALKDLIKEL